MLLGISFHTDLKTTTELNYYAKVTALDRKRTLSLIGTFSNSLYDTSSMGTQIAANSCTKSDLQPLFKG